MLALILSPDLRWVAIPLGFLGVSGAAGAGEEEGNGGVFSVRDHLA